MNFIQQIAEQIKKNSHFNDDLSFNSLFPFDYSLNFYSRNLEVSFGQDNIKKFTLDFKNNKNRLAQLQELNRLIKHHNSRAIKNQNELVSKIPPTGSVYDVNQFTSSFTTIIKEYPMWAFKLSSKNYSGDEVKIQIIINDKELYQIRDDLNDDNNFIEHINRLIFKYLQEKRMESEQMGVWDSDNIWYMPNKRFHKWFQIHDLDPFDNKINKKGTTDSLWAIADEMRYRKDSGEFDTYMDSYRWAEKNIKKIGVVITAKKLEKAYSKAKSEGKVD